MVWWLVASVLIQSLTSKSGTWCKVWCVPAGMEDYVSRESSARVQGAWEGKPQQDEGHRGRGGIDPLTHRFLGSPRVCVPPQHAK